MGNKSCRIGTICSLNFCPAAYCGAALIKQTGKLEFEGLMQQRLKTKNRVREKTVEQRTGTDCINDPPHCAAAVFHDPQNRHRQRVGRVQIPGIGGGTFVAPGGKNKHKRRG